jgi:hypothetical protein
MAPEEDIFTAEPEESEEDNSMGSGDINRPNPPSGIFVS